MRSWLQGAGPVKDRFNMGENPQYRLSFTNEHEKGAVWVLLSRHITSIDDFENNKEFITACGNFDIILDHLSGMSGLFTTPHTPCTVLYLVTMLIGC